MEALTLLGGVDGGWLVGGRQRAGWEGEVWLECKIKFFEKLNNKKEKSIVW